MYKVKIRITYLDSIIHVLQMCYMYIWFYWSNKINILYLCQCW